MSLLLNNPHYCAQEKFDGERRLIEHVDGSVRGINRKGLYVALGDKLAKGAAALPAGDYLLDGEQVGDDFHAFDVLICPKNGDVRARPYAERVELLASLLGAGTKSRLRAVATQFTREAKATLYAGVLARQGEGVVFKDARAPYSPGRPASGGTQVKAKFTESCSVLVGRISGAKRSVALAAFGHAGAVIELGNVTIPPNHAIPDVGQVVEVRYLYAFREGRLFQPMYLGVRDDIDESDCTLAQLKYKPDSGVWFGKYPVN